MESRSDCIINVPTLSLSSGDAVEQPAEEPREEEKSESVKNPSEEV